MIRINLLGHPAAKSKRRLVPEFSVGGSENVPFILAVAATVMIVAAAWWWQSRGGADVDLRHTQVAAEQLQLTETAERGRAREEAEQGR